MLIKYIQQRSWNIVNEILKTNIILHQVIYCFGILQQIDLQQLLKRSDVQRLCDEHTCRCLRNQEKEAAWKFIEGEMNAVTTVDGLEKLQVEWSNVKNNCNKSAGNAIWLEITLECLIFLTLKISCFLNFWGRNCWNQRYCLIRIAKRSKSCTTFANGFSSQTLVPAVKFSSEIQQWFAGPVMTSNLCFAGPQMTSNLCFTKAVLLVHKSTVLSFARRNSYLRKSDFEVASQCSKSQEKF